MKLWEIYDIVYVNFYSDYYENLPPSLLRKYIRPTFWSKLFSVCKGLAYDIWHSLKRKTLQEPEIGKRWIIVDAINNLQSVEYILERNSNFELVTTSASLAHAKPNVKYLSTRFRSRFLFKMLFYVLKNRKRIGKRWDLFMREPGWYESAIQQLEYYRPRSILFTNDHTPANRSKMIVAKRLGIKTGYVQHACVRNDFGELLVDYAFLDGQDSIDKYAKHNGKFTSEIHLVGMPRFAANLPLRKERRQIKVIGIAYNTIDSIREIETLVSKLSEYEIIIRPHPKDSRHIKQSSVKLSDATTENAFQFINNIDALIAGESSIHVEAILLNVPSFLFDFNKQSKIRDLYGFEKNGLIKRYTDSELLKAFELYNQNPRDVFMSAKYYNSMVGHSQEPDSDLMAYELINSKMF